MIQIIHSSIFLSGQTYKISKESNNYCSHCIYIYIYIYICVRNVICRFTYIVIIIIIIIIISFLFIYFLNCIINSYYFVLFLVLGRLSNSTIFL